MAAATKHHSLLTNTFVRPEAHLAEHWTPDGENRILVAMVQDIQDLRLGYLEDIL